MLKSMITLLSGRFIACIACIANVVVILVRAQLGQSR